MLRKFEFLPVCSQFHPIDPPMTPDLNAIALLLLFLITDTCHTYFCFVLFLLRENLATGCIISGQAYYFILAQLFIRQRESFFHAQNWKHRKTTTSCTLPSTNECNTRNINRQISLTHSFCSLSRLDSCR